jgi:hypothetical protein
MSTSPRISTAAAIAALDAMLALLDGGYIQIHEGSPPATLETETSGTLLATLPLNATAFNGAVDAMPGAMATAKAITQDSSADATGTAGYYRAFTSADAATIQGTCGAAAADLILNSTAIVADFPVAISSWIVKIPEAPGEAPGNGES